MKIQGWPLRRWDSVVAHAHLDPFPRTRREGFFLWVLKIQMGLRSQKLLTTRHRRRSWSDGISVKFMCPMKKRSQRCQRAQFLHGRGWTVPHQVHVLVQLLRRPNGPTSGAHALFVPEPCIHVVHHRVPTPVSIESGATTSRSSPMASACAGTQDLMSVLLRTCRSWFAPSEHPFWEIFPFNFVTVRYVLPCVEKMHCSTWNGLASFMLTR